MNPVLYVYGPIGDDYSASAVRALDVAKQLDALAQAGHQGVTVRVNSEGGDVFDGIAIHNSFLRSPLDVTMYVDGIAASAASLIVMAGDRIVAAPSSTVMIHRAYTVVGGNAPDFAKAAQDLEAIDETIARIFVTRTGQPIETIRKMLDDETWMSADEALASGFVDEIASADEGGDEQDNAIRTRPTDSPAKRAARAKLSENMKSSAARLPLREEV